MAQKRYQLIAEELLQQIQQGRWHAGQKLPSLRSLADQKQVSISTVQQAYWLMERRGWVEARHKSGFYVANDQTLEAQLPRKAATPIIPRGMSQWRISLNSTNHDVSEIPHLFGRATPDLTLSSLNPIKKSMSRLARSANPLSLGYGALQGVDSLRQQIARRMIDAGCKVLPQELMITSGCQEAICCALQAVTQPGDIVAFDSPTYYAIIQMIEALGLQALEIPADPATGISIGALEMALERWKVKVCVLTPNFGNPLGYLMPDQDKQKLMQLLNKYDVPLIEDDIYSDLDFRPGRPKAIKAWDTENRVILCSSFSKSVVPGIRVGWVIPGKYFQGVEQQKYIVSLNSATLPQLAMAEYLESGNYDRHLRRVKPLYRQRRDLVKDLIRKYFPAETRISCPKGGLMLWVELPSDINAIELSSLALEQGISIAPGPMFSIDEKYSNYFRFCYGAFDEAKDIAAVEKLGQLAFQLATATINK